MGKSSSSVFVQPSLVLALDPLGQEVARQVASMLAIEGSDTASILTSFWYLQRDVGNRYALTTIKGNSTTQAHRTLNMLEDIRLSSQGSVTGSYQANTTLPLHRQARQCFLESAGQIRMQIEAALHELRSHQRLMEAGVDEKKTFNLDVVILGDLTDPQTRGILAPFCSLVQGLLAHDPYTQGHLLLSMAQFPPPLHPDSHKVPETQPDLHSMGETGSLTETSVDIEIQVYLALQELVELSDSSARAYQTVLSEALGDPEPIPLQCPIYLFDRRKEGTLEVRDIRELELIIANFLAALLVSDLTAVSGWTTAQGESSALPAPFQAVGASVLFFEPSNLVEECTSQFGHGLVRTLLGETNQNPLSSNAQEAERAVTRASQDIADELNLQLGDLRAWVESLIEGMPFRFIGHSQYPALEYFGQESFMPAEPKNWSAAIRTALAQFESDCLPELMKQLDTRAEMLCSQLQLNLSQALDDLPGRSTVSCGCLEPVRMVLNHLEAEIQTRPSLLKPTKGPSLHELEALLNRLDTLLGNPRPRPGLRSLLSQVRQEIKMSAQEGAAQYNPLAWLARLLYNWLHRWELEIQQIKASSLHLFQALCAARFQVGLHKKLSGMVDVLHAELAQAHEDLDSLEAALRQAAEMLAVRKASLETISSFRVEIADDELVHIAQQRWSPLPDRALHNLVREHAFFLEWQSTSPENFAARLAEYGRTVFFLAYELTLAEALPLCCNFNLDDALTTLARGAVPSLRPNFDRLGGGGYARENRFFIATSGLQASQHTLQGKGGIDWRLLTCRHANLLILCRVRQDLPLQALGELLRRGERAYRQLSEQERKSAHLFDEWAPRVVSAKTNGRYGSVVG